MAACAHLDRIELADLRAQVTVCGRYPATGERWVRLRMYMTCGHIECCDSSPNKHAGAHFRSSGHPIVRSAEPGWDWRWCYADEVMFGLSRE